MIDVATRARVLLPEEQSQRAQALMWVFAALNSVEPFLMNVAEVAYFMKDEETKAKRRPVVESMAKQRLGQLQVALGDRPWLAGNEFSVADLMTSSVLKIAGRLDMLNDYPNLIAYQDRCFDRRAYRKAIEDQCATIAEHSPEDMRYNRAKSASG